MQVQDQNDKEPESLKVKLAGATEEMEQQFQITLRAPAPNRVVGEQTHRRFSKGSLTTEALLMQGFC